MLERLRPLSFRTIGAIYVWIAIIVLFSIWQPDTFPTWQTARTILNQNAVAGLVALSLVAPLAARVFDLSIGYVLGFACVLVAYLLAHTGIAWPLAALITFAVVLGLGVVNAVTVVALRIDSFIGTLATGALMQAGIIIITGEEPITGGRLTGPFSSLATISAGGLALPVFVTLAAAGILWWLLDHTVTGRRLYATGFNDEAARLTGVRVSRLRFASLLASAAVAGLAGILLCAQISSGSPDVGPSYLLDGYAAAFLGATQFRPGRFNPWGTLVATMLLGTGHSGLSLVGAPTWSSSLFTGVVLLLALGVSTAERRTIGARGRLRLRARRTAAPTPDQFVETVAE